MHTAALLFSRSNDTNTGFGVCLPILLGALIAGGRGGGRRGGRPGWRWPPAAAGRGPPSRALCEREAGRLCSRTRQPPNKDLGWHLSGPELITEGIPNFFYYYFDISFGRYVILEGNLLLHSVSQVCGRGSTQIGRGQCSGGGGECAVSWEAGTRGVGGPPSSKSQQLRQWAKGSAFCRGSIWYIRRRLAS